MPTGMVLTGGGSLLSGMSELAQKKFKMQVNVGFPNACSDNASEVMHNIPDVIKSPIYATGYGLLLYAAGKNNLALATDKNDTSFSKVFKRMRSWIYDFL